MSAGGGRVPGAADHRRPPPVVEQTSGNPLRHQRHLHERRRQAGRHHHGPQHGGQEHLTCARTALIVLMAQMGSFVPAKSAVIGLTDRVFTRIGASMTSPPARAPSWLEMTEVAAILRHALARASSSWTRSAEATTTFDGMAIAGQCWNTAPTKRKLGAKTMFATNYSNLHPGGDPARVKNYNITAKKHRAAGWSSCERSSPAPPTTATAIEVAKLAGCAGFRHRQGQGYLKELEAGGRKRARRRPRPDRRAAVPCGHGNRTR
jgi:DNA mismatch repair protein MutS